MIKIDTPVDKILLLDGKYDNLAGHPSKPQLGNIISQKGSKLQQTVIHHFIFAKCFLKQKANISAHQTWRVERINDQPNNACCCR